MNPISLKSLAPFGVKIIPPPIETCETFGERLAHEAFTHHFSHFNQVNPDGTLVFVENPESDLRFILVIKPDYQAVHSALCLPLAKEKLADLDRLFGAEEHEWASWGPMVEMLIESGERFTKTDRIVFKDGKFYLLSLYKKETKEQAA